jgi:hypothetical protein
MQVVSPLSYMCWNVIEQNQLDVIPVKSRRCTHSLDSAKREDDENVFLLDWPPKYTCGCVASAAPGKDSVHGARMTSRFEVEKLLKYLREHPPPVEEVTVDPDAVIEDWLEAAEEMFTSNDEASDGEDSVMNELDDVFVVEETEAESEDEETEVESEDEDAEMLINQIPMVGYQWDDYTINYVFRPNRTFHFHFRATLHGNPRTYRTGQWHPSMHKLYCMNCMGEIIRRRMQAGELLSYIGQAVTLCSGPDGKIIIPYWFRPAFFLTEDDLFYAERETLMNLIAGMELPMLHNEHRLLWEFHCSSCFKNLFTESVTDVTMHSNELV